MLRTADAHGLYRQFGFARAQAGPLPGTAAPRRTRAAPRAGRQRRGAAGRPGRPPRAAGRTSACAAWSPRPPAAAELYRWSAVPQDEGPGAAGLRRDGGRGPRRRDRRRRSPSSATARRHRHRLDALLRPRLLAAAGRPGPPRRSDTGEIGYTWLSPSAIRTAANTEMKRLMLTHAFEDLAGVAPCPCTPTPGTSRRGRPWNASARASRASCARTGSRTDRRPRDSARYSVTARRVARRQAAPGRTGRPLRLIGKRRAGRGRPGLRGPVSPRGGGDGTGEADHGGGPAWGRAAWARHQAWPASGSR